MCMQDGRAADQAGLCDAHLSLTRLIGVLWGNCQEMAASGDAVPPARQRQAALKALLCL